MLTMTLATLVLTAAADLQRPDESFLQEMDLGGVESAPFPYAAVITGGAGVVLTAVGAVLYFGASSSIDSIDARYAKGAGLSQADHDATRAAMSRGYLGSLLMVGGVGVTIGGAVWWLAARPRGQALGLTLRF